MFISIVPFANILNM